MGCIPGCIKRLLFEVVEIEPRTSCVLDKCSVAGLHPQLLEGRGEGLGLDLIKGLEASRSC